jgi:hypothetical protein
MWPWGKSGRFARGILLHFVTTGRLLLCGGVAGRLLRMCRGCGRALGRPGHWPRLFRVVLAVMVSKPDLP